MTSIAAPVVPKTLGIRPPAFELPTSAHVGRVRLAVSSLERSLAFYNELLGLAVLSRTAQFAELGAGDKVLLELDEQPGLRPLGRAKRIGLYHTAFLLPTQRDLALLIAHLQRRGIPFAASDHGVSLALYLTDPDGLDVEVYADRDRDQWITDGPELVMETKALRFTDLPPVGKDQWQGAPAGTTVGHMHFYVEDLAAAAAFYHAALGMAVTTWRYPGALFLSAGGYHHHVGVNLWAAGSPVASETDPRILFWELVLPTADDVQRAAESLRAGGFSGDPADANLVTDSSGIRLNLRAAH
ncbi:MAG: VOC family protein [Acidobacteriaceae bacterium]